jgi:hypothetical protein
MAFTGKEPDDTYLAILNLGDAQETLPATTPTETVLDAAGNASILGLSQNTIEFIGVLLADVASGVVMETGIDFEADAVTTSSVLYQSDTAVGVFWTTGDPEGSLTAGIGSLALRDDGTSGATLYIKESGTGNTGWVPYDFVSSFLDLTDTPGTFTADKWLKVNAGGTLLEWADAPIGSFIGLSDTPANYTGHGTKTLRVNSAPDGVEFVDSTFLNLTDTPSSYTGDGLIAVNPGGTALIESMSAAAQGAVVHKGASGWSFLAAGSDGDVLTTHGAAADPSWTTITGSGLPAANHGDVTYYNGSNWVALTYGTAGEVLTTQGVGAAPTWELGLPGSPVQGDVLYYSGSAWARLAPGTNGQFLKTQGAAANPTWDDVDAFPASPNQGEIVYYTGSVWANLAVGTDGYKLTTHSTGANPTWEANTFTGLSDTPASYSGLAFRIPRINSGETALEFVDNSITGGIFGDVPSDWGSDGDIVYSNGSSQWQYQSTLFFLNEKINNPFPDEGEMIMNRSDATGWYVGEPMSTTEVILSETWFGAPVYMVAVDFGAGPNATSKSVASGLAVTDVVDIVDIRAVMNTVGEGHVGRTLGTGEEEYASFVFNKIDAKVYCDSGSQDLSGNDYKVILKYIKEPGTMSGASPHLKINISGGTWSSLAQGVHILSPANYNYFYTPDYDTPTDMSFTWTGAGVTGAQTPTYTQEQIQMDAGFNGTTRDSKVQFKNGATSASWSTKSYSTVSPTGSYAKAQACGDRLFTSYTAGGVTVTLARTSEYTKRP